MKIEILAEAVKELADRHYAPDTRHIGADDYAVLVNASRTLEELAGDIEQSEALTAALQLVGKAMRA